MSDWRDFKSVRVADEEWMAFTDRAAQFIHQQVLELGYRHHPEVQSHFFARPAGAEGQLGGLMMRWTELGEDQVVADVQVPDISGLSLAQKTDLHLQLKRDGFGGPDVPARIEGAEVTQAVMAGDRFTHDGKVREVVALDGEWAHVADPESGWHGRMKLATLRGWGRA